MFFFHEKNLSDEWAILFQNFQSFKSYSYYIFEETRNILVNGMVNYENIVNAIYLNGFYLILSIFVFYYSFDKARDKGTLINMGE